MPDDLNSLTHTYQFQNGIGLPGLITTYIKVKNINCYTVPVKGPLWPHHWAFHSTCLTNVYLIHRCF